ncbi:Glucose transporter type 1 [Portunus trituberculatus]|uniref:Glucose transporter type 1 n=1 Tax=Portunus trituberculatus TaxID=210409 RepID=A0A5B7D6M0_PORTR|nr:Glucose transporter type 1 [Portunus trituberculatus]
MGFSQMSNSFEMLILGRLVIGINCGLNTSLVPMYISEIAPLNLRGGLGTVNQLAVTIGLLLSQVLGIEQLLGNKKAWPILLGLAVVPAVMQMVLLPVCPESPRYLLMSRQMEDEARRALRRLRASSHVEEDIEEMRAEEAASQTEAHMTMLQLVRNSNLRMPLTIGVVMQLSQQLSGINAVLYYSTSLFTAAGLEEWQSKYATLGVGSVMVVMTLVSIPLMDRAGRRTLHLYGLGGMFIFSIFITISLLIKEMMSWMTFISVISTLCFVIFFSVGPGSIPWMITAELFSQGPRPAAMSIAVLVNWLSNFIVGIGFPKMQETFENYTFLPFSVLLGCFWIFTYYKVPETKNKTFEEISAIFTRGVDRYYIPPSRLPVPSLHRYLTPHRPSLHLFLPRTSTSVPEWSCPSLTLSLPLPSPASHPLLPISASTQETQDWYRIVKAKFHSTRKSRESSSPNYLLLHKKIGSDKTIEGGDGSLWGHRGEGGGPPVELQCRPPPALSCFLN